MKYETVGYVKPVSSKEKEAGLSCLIFLVFFFAVEHSASMKRRSELLLPLLVMVTLGGVVWLTLPPSEPVYEGKTVGFWLRHPKEVPVPDYSGGLRGPLFKLTFPRMDSNAVPSLITALGKHDGRWDKIYAFSWNRLPKFGQRLLPAPGVRDSWVRVNAATLLSKIKSGAKPSVSALFRMMLTDDEEMARRAAASTLLAMGETGPEWLEAWRQAAKDESPEVQNYAHEAMNRHDRKENGSTGNSRSGN
jgi:hypothetical protein